MEHESKLQLTWALLCRPAWLRALQNERKTQTSSLYKPIAVVPDELLTEINASRSTSTMSNNATIFNV
jgi:hypothetical protein